MGNYFTTGSIVDCASVKSTKCQLSLSEEKNINLKKINSFFHADDTAHSLVQSREKEVAIGEAEVKSKMKVDAATIEKSKAETKKTIAEPNLIEVQTAQASDDSVLNFLMKRKQLEEVRIKKAHVDEDEQDDHTNILKNTSNKISFQLLFYMSLSKCD